MSTTIYNGHKFTGTLKELFEVLCTIRNKYREEAKILYKELITQNYTIEVCTFTEKLLQGFKDKLYSSFTHYDWVRYFEAHIRLGYKSPLNTEASIVIFIDSKNKLYLTAYLNNTDSYDLSPYSDKFQYYGYWNNTDRPDSCSVKEWNNRKNKWNELIPGYKPTKDYGFIFNIIEESDVHSLLLDVR